MIYSREEITSMNSPISHLSKFNHPNQHEIELQFSIAQVEA